MVCFCGRSFAGQREIPISTACASWGGPRSGSKSLVQGGRFVLMGSRGAADLLRLAWLPCGEVTAAGAVAGTAVRSIHRDSVSDATLSRGYLRQLPLL